MEPDCICVGDKVDMSPAGSGEITGITDAGYPQVNHVAVAILRRVDGTGWNPLGFDVDAVVAQWARVDEEASKA